MFAGSFYGGSSRGQEYNRVVWWNLGEPEPVAEADRLHGRVMCLSILPGNGHVVLGNWENVGVHLYGVKDGKYLGRLGNVQDEHRVMGLAVSSDGQLLASGGNDTTILLRRLHSGDG